MAMMMKTATDAVDESLEQLGWLQRRIAKRHFRRNPEAREDAVERVMLALSQDARTDPELSQGFSSGAITASTPFSIDVERWKVILDLVLEYLPKILKLFM